MSALNKNTGLYTDHYEITMAQGYYLSGRQNYLAGFDYFFRNNPFEGGYTLFAGLETLLETLKNYRFDDEDCRYLKSIGFDKKFIEYLRGFEFRGDIYSVKEGEVAFPNEPVVRVEGNIVETQLIETLLLNILNFQSLIATKAARMRWIAGNRLLLDFGLRRAQGLGAIHASRAAIIGGFDMTSNLYSAYYFGLTSSGTMAHSWIQTFDSEIAAFREFIKFYPNTAILLVDTYDTLNSGVPNAITVAKELEEKGGKLTGIRLDSGDLAYLSKVARKLLNEAQLEYVKIVVSNQLDEYLIRSLIEQKAPIDAFGVGTALVTGKDEAALDGVYKLNHIEGDPKMKLSDNLSKMTLPADKRIFRFFNRHEATFEIDGIEIIGSDVPDVLYHPQQPEKNTSVKDLRYEEILDKVMEKGKPLFEKTTINSIAEYAKRRLEQIPDGTRRFENPHTYRVGIGSKLMRLRDRLKDSLWKH